MHGWQANKKTHLRYASEQGLCPKNKNHVLCTWMIIDNAESFAGKADGRKEIGCSFSLTKPFRIYYNVYKIIFIHS